MPLTIATVTANLAVGSLEGNTDALLSKEAIQQPGEHLFGAKPGPDRDLLMGIVHPLPPLLQEAMEALGAEDDRTMWGLVGYLAVRLRKIDNTALVPADFSRK